MNDRDYWNAWGQGKPHYGAYVPQVPQEAFRIAQLEEVKRLASQLEKERDKMYPDADVINAITEVFDTGDGTVTVAGRVDRDERTYDVRLTIRDEVVVIPHALASAIASAIQTVVSQVSHHEGRR